MDYARSFFVIYLFVFSRVIFSKISNTILWSILFPLFTGQLAILGELLKQLPLPHTVQGRSLDTKHKWLWSMGFSYHNCGSYTWGVLIIVYNIRVAKHIWWLIWQMHFRLSFQIGKFSSKSYLLVVISYPNNDFLS